MHLGYKESMAQENITHFSGKSVIAYMVVVTAICELAIVLWLTADGAWGGDDKWLLAAYLFVGPVLGLLLWGATMPFVSWSMYYHDVKGYSWFRSISTVLGGLVTVGFACYGFAWLAEKVTLVGAVVSLLSVASLVAAPWYIIKERKKHAALKELYINEKRLD